MNPSRRPRRVLIVDDEEFVRVTLAAVLERAGYECDSAADIATAKREIGSGSFEIVLCDIDMPDGSGMDLLRQVSAERSDIAIVMVTGQDDAEVAREAIEMGTYGYVVKPYTSNEILINVANALRRADLERERSMHAAELESKLGDRTRALRQVIQRVDAYASEGQVPWKETLDRLTGALALRDEETRAHLERVSLYSELLAERAAIGSWTPTEIRQASMLHDVGKIGVPDAILTKPTELTLAELEMMQRHCELGYRLLTGSPSPLLDLAATIALTHHERWDGGGYPRRLAADDIPVEGRIVAIADVFDALTSPRAYRLPVTAEEALATIRSESGEAFDPDLVGVFVESLAEITAIREEHPDGPEDAEVVRVLLVEDEELLAQGLLRLLESADNVGVAGLASTAAEAIQMGVDRQPDVVVLDWQLPDGEGGDVAQRLREQHPAMQIIVLTGLPVESVLPEAIETGCAAVLAKTRAFEEVIDAIRAAHAGELTIPLSKLSSIVGKSKPLRRRAGADLTARELEVLGYLAEGLSNEAIAERLTLSLHTVRNHVQRIIMKMGAHSKLEAVAKALRAGVIDVGSRYAS